MKTTKSLFATAVFLLACGAASAAGTASPKVPDGAEVTMVQNGGTMNFTGPVNVTHEKAIGSKVTFSLTEGQKRTIYVSRGDKVTSVPVRIDMPPRKKKQAS